MCDEPLTKDDKEYTIAVIIPVYNCEQYLGNAIRSVLDQPCKDAFVIVVNDGSRDGSLRVAADIAAVSNRILVISQENEGVSSARNKGIETALKMHVRWLAFLDSDDTWVSDFYDEKLRDRILAEDKDAYSFSYLITNQIMDRGRFCTPRPKDPITGEINRYGGYFCSYLYKTEKLKKYNIRFPKGIKTQEDRVFEYLFFSVCTSSMIIDRPIFLYRSNSRSVTHNPMETGDLYFAHVIPAWEYAYIKLKDLLGQTNTVSEKDLHACLTMQKTYLAEFIGTACENGMRPELIRKTIDDSGRADLFNHPEIWVDAKRKRLWEDFYKSPMAVYFRCRARGLGVSLLKRFRNTSIVERLRYPVDLKDILSEQSE